MKQKITASVSAILIALSLVGLNADQAIAQGKTRKGAKVRAGSDARIAKTQGQAKMHLEDISLGVMNKPQAKRRSARNGGGGNAKSADLENSLVSGVKVDSQTEPGGNVSGSNANRVALENVQITSRKANSQAKRLRTRNGNVRAVYDLRKAKP